MKKGRFKSKAPEVRVTLNERGISMLKWKEWKHWYELNAFDTWVENQEVLQISDWWSPFSHKLGGRHSKIYT